MPPLLALVPSLIDTVKSYFPPDMTEEQKAQIKNDMSLVMTNAALQLEQEVTKRAQADMSSDSWLSKNIRPLIMIYLLIVFSAFAIASASLNIDKAYVEILQQMLMTAFGFYFAGRTLEKITSIIKGK
jgi:hypothetical protein